MDVAEERLLPEQGRDVPLAERWRVQRCFLALGCTCCVTFESLILSFAYLQQHLGKEVLAHLGACQWTCALSGMFFFIVVRGFFAAQLGRREYVWVISLSLLYMLAFNVSMACSAAVSSPPSATVLYAAVAVNGAATGSLQCLLAALAGHFGQPRCRQGVKWCSSSATSMAFLRGMSAGILGPCLAQIMLLPALRPDQANVSAAVVSGMAIFIVLLGLLALQCLVREAFAEAFDPVPTDATLWDSENRNLFIGRIVAHHPEKRHILVQKLSSTGFLCALQGLNALASVVPAMKLTYLHPSGVSTFVAAYLGTFLLAGGNIAESLGRVVAPFRWAAKAPQGFAILAVAVRLGFAGLCTWGVLSQSLSTCVVATLYMFGAFVNGVNTICMSARTQAICGYSLEMPCTLSGQYTMFAMQFGFIMAAVAATRF